MGRLCTSICLLFLICVVISSVLIGIVIGIQSESENSVFQLPLTPSPRNRGSSQRLTPGSIRNDSSSYDRTTTFHPTKCYDSRGQAQRCVPEFVNAAFMRDVEATDTCGLIGPAKYCVQSGDSGDAGSYRIAGCDYCDARNESLSHPSSSLTDVNDHNRQTWWQSRTMYDGIQNPKAKEPVKQVNLTLHLGKAFDVTYIRLKFFSPRPASFAVYKKRRDEEDWIPFQYYAYNCMDTYGVPDRPNLLRDNETKALCTSEFSDISPFTGANVVFTTLEGRPSAHDFENSPVLQVSLSVGIYVIVSPLCVEVL